MKKNILICGLLLMSHIVLAQEAETCANGAGTVVIGNVTGHKYCLSKTSVNMDWWNAYSWCKAQG